MAAPAEGIALFLGRLTKSHCSHEVISQPSLHPIDLKTDPRITDWNEAHRQFGSNFNKFIPAHRNLLKRVQKPGTSIPFINGSRHSSPTRDAEVGEEWRSGTGDTERVFLKLG